MVNSFPKVSVKTPLFLDYAKNDTLDDDTLHGDNGINDSNDDENYNFDNNQNDYSNHLNDNNDDDYHNSHDDDNDNQAIMIFQRMHFVEPFTCEKNPGIFDICSYIYIYICR